MTHKQRSDGPGGQEMQMQIYPRKIDVDAIAAYLADRTWVTIANVSRDVLGNKVEDGSKCIPNLPSITAALRQLGWRKVRASKKHWERIV